jgi:plasmid maintenance system antidote protein VapI
MRLSEDNVAARIAWEMKRRRWSQDRLAKETAAAGYALPQSAISKIVSPAEGNQRRAITVDEAIALAAVFEVSLEELTYPLDAARSQEARRLVAQLDRLERRSAQLADEAKAVRAQLEDLREEERA